jgi:hypothetical protein
MTCVQVSTDVDLLIQKDPSPTPWPEAKEPWDVDCLVEKLKHTIRMRANDTADLDLFVHNVTEPDPIYWLEDLGDPEDFDRVLKLFEDEMKELIEVTLEERNDAKKNANEPMPEFDNFLDYYVRTYERKLRAFNITKNGEPGERIQWLADKLYDPDEDVELKKPYVRFHPSLGSSWPLTAMSNEDDRQWYSTLLEIVSQQQQQEMIAALPEVNTRSFQVPTCNLQTKNNSSLACIRTCWHDVAEL